MAKIIIKEVLEKKGIKTARLIPFISMPRSTVYKIVRGSKSPTIDQLECFADVLGVPLEELYDSEYSGKN